MCEQRCLGAGYLMSNDSILYFERKSGKEKERERARVKD